MVHFDLPGAVLDAAMELAVAVRVVVAMAGDNGFIDIAYIIDELGDLWPYCRAGNNRWCRGY